jgi:mono/diheme cytochrome c family protein
LFRKKTETPIEQRDYSFYYFILSGILFLATGWAVIDEISTRQPWKDYQREYYRESVRMWEEELDRAHGRVDYARLDQLEADLEEALAARDGEDYQNARNKWRSLEEELRRVRQQWQFARGYAEETYYQYRQAVVRDDNTDRLRERLDRFDSETRQHLMRIAEIEEEQRHLEQEMDRYDSRIREVRGQINNLYNEVHSIENRLTLLRSSSIEIKQVILDEFERTSWGEPKKRVDRCMTCHIGYFDDKFEGYVQPFGKHPRQDLLQIHNVENFGCTPCHDGQPMALSAGYAHGDIDRHWDFPILRGQDVYASCNDCHSGESILENASPFTRGHKIVMESGCVGCHEISGLTDLPKVGPELNRLTAKTTPGWIYTWVKNPNSYNQHTRMPNFLLNDEEAEAVTAYLLSIAEEYQPQRSYPGGGNPTRGKQLVESVGCLGCHVVEDNDRVRQGRGLGYDIAPELTKVGGKVSADWLYDWIQDPKKYRPDTRMPNLRLSDAETRDITAYLLSLNGKVHDDTIDLRLNDTAVISKGMDLIRSYGCHGCHSINGMEKEGRVSVSLSNFGRKAVEEMDFGETTVEHTWDDWLHNKLKNSRIFQTERIIQMMPVFNFTDQEINDIRTFLRGMRIDDFGGKFKRTDNGRMNDIQRGQKFIIDNNCIACHTIEAIDGAITSVIEESGLRPPVITGIGAKAQEQWLYDFLRSPSTVRGWLEVRMPTFDFTDEEISLLIRYFLAISEKEFKLRDYERFTPDPQIVQTGRQLFDQLQCARCHPSGADLAGVTAADLAPNLDLARGRLKPDWILDWLHDPQEIEPGTRMPTFFPDGQTPLPGILEGNVDKQIEALRDYTWTLGRPVRASR